MTERQVYLLICICVLCVFFVFECPKADKILAYFNFLKYCFNSFEKFLLFIAGFNLC
jgi:hypothetical protein